MTLFYFAWVTAADTTFQAAYAREDESLFSFRVSQEEGGFATLDIEIENPRKGLLAASRGRWAWLSWQDGTAVTPLFFGRVIGAPEDQVDEVLRLTLLARPDDYEAQKDTAADTLRVLPWFDPVWIAPDLRADPDLALEARSALWHVDRTSHAVTASDILEGEDGTVAIGGNALRDSVQVSYTHAPSARVEVSAEMAWDQRASGTVEVSRRISDAAFAAGTTRRNVISSYTGGGLLEDWPRRGDEIGEGWRVSRSSTLRMDGRYFRRQHRRGVTLALSRVAFPLWTIKAQMTLGYDVERRLTERATFAMTAGLQPVTWDDGDAAPIKLEVHSSAAAEEIDGAVPIGDTARRSWFHTARGRQSLENLALRARALLRSQSRAVEVSADVPFDQAVQLTCRHSASLTDARLPGGTATGKVVSYTFGLIGDSGEMFGKVRLGCAAGDGVAVSAAAAVNGYAEDGYMEAGYQAIVSGEDMLAPADTVLAHYGGVAIGDDGVSFPSLDQDGAVVSATITNGQTAQEAVIDTTTVDAAEAKRNLEAAHTRIELCLRPLDGLSFETYFAVAAGRVAIPALIDLEAE